jgi:hypothetical protein
MLPRPSNLIEITQNKQPQKRIKFHSEENRKDRKLIANKQFSMRLRVVEELKQHTKTKLCAVKRILEKF